jgi:hypothetical protein
LSALICLSCCGKLNKFGKFRHETIIQQNEKIEEVNDVNEMIGSEEKVELYDVPDVKMIEIPEINPSMEESFKRIIKDEPTTSKQLPIRKRKQNVDNKKKMDVEIDLTGGFLSSEDEKFKFKTVKTERIKVENDTNGAKKNRTARKSTAPKVQRVVKQDRKKLVDDAFGASEEDSTDEAAWMEDDDDYFSSQHLVMPKKTRTAKKNPISEAVVDLTDY